MLTWRKTSAYSVAAREGDYAVSRATVLDLGTGELMDKFTAWHGPDLKGAPPGTGGFQTRPFPERLGLCATAAEAKALCQTHHAGAGLKPALQGAA